MPWQVGDYITEGEKPFDQGSFGTVWRARRRSDGIRVALKLVLLTETADARERIAAERHGAMLQQQFERAHGMVPAVYEFGQDGGDLFIAMELIEGGALTELIKAGPLDPREAAGYAIRICEFLDKAHSFAATVEGVPYDRVVHADLKPGHVLVAPTGEVKVLDFGIAKALAKTTQVTTNNWGTSAYASPERLDRGHVNEHVDFWSLGVMLYEMVAGHRPYPALDRNRSLLEHAIRTNAPREPLPATTPPELAAIINKLLAYQPEHRYPSAAAIQSDLERFLAGERPDALAGYTVPETLPIGGTTTKRPAITTDEIPPTDPLPAPVAGGAAPAPGPARRARLRERIGRFGWAAALFALIGFVATEGVAWVEAERFRDALGSLETRTLAATRTSYDSIRAWSILDTGLRLRVHARLQDRLIALADTVIADYRREQPTMGLSDWKQALQSLQWAAQLSPIDDEVRAKMLTCEGHVIRLSARGQPAAEARQMYLRAVDRFRAAAAQDPDTFDPYLGISRLAVYGLEDVDMAHGAIQDARDRGFAAGRRERAILGDGFLRRAHAARALARTLSGEDRRRELERARADYAGCIAAFETILTFADSAANLERCKRYMKMVEREIDASDASGAA